MRQEQLRQELISVPRNTPMVLVEECLLARSDVESLPKGFRNALHHAKAKSGARVRVNNQLTLTMGKRR